MDNVKRPSDNEIPEIYLSYTKLAEQENLFETLRYSRDLTISIIDSIPADKENYIYAKGKWSLKTVLTHMIDSERVFAYRALRFSRKDNTELPGFDENEYAANCNADAISLEDIRKEFLAVREATVQLFKNMTEEMLSFKGIANELKVSAAVLGWIISGHNLHHCYVIKRRYLGEHHEIEDQK
jgi:uncharacterized damage-inducible protein DinB